jgi:abequosyltransferase
VNAVKLSLCIPTHNFGRFIADTLHSILEQDGAEEIEVVVVDGASTDNTADVVTSLQQQWPQIKYFKLPAKGGIDRDMAKSVELATGEYCWLFSSDDIMRNGALELALNEIKQGYDLYLCRHTEYTLEMQFITEYPILRLSSPAVFDLANPNERAKYASLAINTEPFFSFMGGIIVKKSIWDSVPLNEAFVGSCWAHAARLFEIIPRGLIVKYVARSYLNRRQSNDSFMDKGVINRRAIAIEGYLRIVDTFFGHDSVEAFHVRRVLKDEHPLDLFISCLNLSKNKPETENRALLDSLIRKLYCDGSDDDKRTLLAYAAHSSKLFPASARQHGWQRHDLKRMLKNMERHLLRPPLRAIRAAFRKRTALRAPTRAGPSPEQCGPKFAFSGKRLIELDGFGLYVMPDDYIGGSIISGNCYDPHIIRTIQRVLRRGDVFVDFTANIGFFTFLAASLVKKEGKVIAFEPNPQNIQLIYSTLLVSPGLNIKIYPYAVSDSPGIAKLETVASGDGLVNRDAPETNESWRDDLLVQRVAPDSVLKDEPKIDLIKIDVEAHKPAPLRGLESLLRRHRPKLITKLHPSALKLNNKGAAAAHLEQLYGLGYKLSIIEEPTGDILEVSCAEELLNWKSLDREPMRLALFGQS